MSKVEMDLSEYNGMLETKRLLEQANADLKKAYEENERLKAEKIEAMEQNKHTVTVIETVNTYTTAYVPRHEVEIRQRLQTVIGKDFMDRIPVGLTAETYSRFFLDALYQFEEHKSPSINKERVYSRDLEEMRAVMRAELKDQLEDDVKSQLGRVDHLQEALTKAKEEVEELRKQLKDDTKLRGVLEAQVNELNSVIKESSERIAGMEKTMEIYDLNLYYKLKNFTTDVLRKSGHQPFFGSRQILRELYMDAVDMVAEIQQNDKTYHSS